MTSMASWGVTFLAMLRSAVATASSARVAPATFVAAASRPIVSRTFSFTTSGASSRSVRSKAGLGGRGAPRALPRLQVAAETGQTLGFAYRPASAAHNPSPAALRLLLEGPAQVRVLKCRGGLAPARAIAL